MIRKFIRSNFFVCCERCHTQQTVGISFPGREINKRSESIERGSRERIEGIEMDIEG